MLTPPAPKATIKNSPPITDNVCLKKKKKINKKLIKHVVVLDILI